MTLFEVNQAARSSVKPLTRRKHDLRRGHRPNMGDDIRITVIATGFERSSMPRRALERQPRSEYRRPNLPPTIGFRAVSVHANLATNEPKSTR